MMPVRQKRKTAGRVFAKHFGVSERTVRNHMAEERDTYEARADYRRNSPDHASAREIMG